MEWVLIADEWLLVDIHGDTLALIIQHHDYYQASLNGMFGRVVNYPHHFKNLSDCKRYILVRIRHYLIYLLDEIGDLKDGYAITN